MEERRTATAAPSVKKRSVVAESSQAEESSADAGCGHDGWMDGFRRRGWVRMVDAVMNAGDGGYFVHGH